MDIDVLRVEIKSWERAFKQEHGRAATVDDIKRLPDIGESLPFCSSRVFMTVRVHSGEVQDVQAVDEGYCCA